MFSLNFKIVCLTEKRLNESFSSQNCIPAIYTVYRCDRYCHTKLRGGGALIAVSESVFGARRRSDFEYFHECVWVEITTTGGRNLTASVV
jgi:hypothetical protein